MGGICVFPTNNDTVIKAPFTKVGGKLQPAPLVDPKGKREPLQAGTCTAQAVLWCKKILSGVSPETSRPKELAAGILQAVFINAGNVRADKATNQMNTLLEATGLKCGGGYRLIPTEITAQVCENPGVYLIFTTRHAIAAKTGEGTFYYFEPENGLWLFNIRPDFRRAIHKNYMSEAADPGVRWAAFELALD